MGDGSVVFNGKTLPTTINMIYLMSVIEINHDFATVSKVFLRFEDKSAFLLKNRIMKLNLLNEYSKNESCHENTYSYRWF